MRLPKDLRAILRRLLQKEPAARYGSAAELAADLQAMTRRLEGGWGRFKRWQVAAAAIVLVATTAAAVAEYHAAERRRWAREEAIPQIASLLAQERYARAFHLVTESERYLAGDPEFERTLDAATRVASIESSPSGATVEVKDYGDPSEAWLALGTTPLEHVRLPRGYLRLKVSKPGIGESVTAPLFGPMVTVDLEHSAQAPPGMVPVAAGPWGDITAYFGPIAADLPAFFIDRHEVTNHDYQVFVDAGGYTNPTYWKQPFVRDGRTLTFDETMAHVP